MFTGKKSIKNHQKMPETTDPTQKTALTPQEIADQLLEGPFPPHFLEKVAACSTPDEAIRMAYTRLAQFGINPGPMLAIKGFPIPENMPPLEVPNIPIETIEWIVINTKNTRTLRSLLSSVEIIGKRPESPIESPDAPTAEFPAASPEPTETNPALTALIETSIEAVRSIVIKAMKDPDSIPHIKRKFPFIVAEGITDDKMPPLPEILDKRKRRRIRPEDRAAFEAERDKAILARVLKREEILLETHREVCATLESKDSDMQRTLEDSLAKGQI